jgi:hypothetical protein
MMSQLFEHSARAVVIWFQQPVSRDCGSTITTEDIMKYKLRGL